MRAFRRSRWWPATAALIACAAPSCARHDTGVSTTGPAPSATAVLGIGPEDAAKVLARVGDRTITLGDYAAALDRMDRFERLRYQTPDRRKQLLEEMIEVELLAREAERRGLAARPETQELVRQILRDEVLRDLREHQPKLEDIPVSDVRAYYEAHRADFREPERRRISVILVPSRGAAERVLAEARDADTARWGDLVKKYSTQKPDDPSFLPPSELAGDVGLVTPPSWGKTDNPRVDEAVRAAAFEIDRVGGVLGRVVSDGNRHYLVRLTGKNAPRDRALEEADRTIRVRLAEEKMRAAEARLEQELRQRFPVQVNEAALATVPVSSAAPRP